MKKFSFENLEVWNDVKLLTKDIYIMTKSFPDEEKYGLVSQVRRAVISVSSNIAEGSARNSAKDQAHFYQIAFSSLMEVLSQLIISVELEFINNNQLKLHREKISDIAYKLNALRSAALKRTKK
ncbi:four helix bundle protein [Psychroflexus aestuariivivens]|uniref:four helix bundle protein n=1 Tax=Psychroflexus aestuariivivens TaxID=1795040 RepID=UPI000FDB01F5|nr:four helix bundle protein [Psychroflexus aestuariivivens]